MDGGLKALRSLGHERQMEHFAGVDDRFQQDRFPDVRFTTQKTAFFYVMKKLGKS